MPEDQEVCAFDNYCDRTLILDVQVFPSHCQLLNSGKTQAEVGELLGVSANTIGRELKRK
ncbi:hypothetical protein BPLS_P4210 [Bathymodiolus platifrons methanotrophic gill symbiont]|uniref:helix-turn-helix domain-containing protein n=1 Tax=Bathymodiolus platifrons methanotrophic gill symbiont TaxID=113268 RepID=UPI000B41A036|nr:helix-turn-helix domain-containing protein [Bathymodiolus platifrons methanotrophic gill symbiont]GFO76433.1 hypothetical protein BPLS_P4210 [Bathymodiolus platifrons methanotrophic gill symbiont]